MASKIPPAFLAKKTAPAKKAAAPKAPPMKKGK